MSELYRRNIWRDAKTVNVIGTETAPLIVFLPPSLHAPRFLAEVPGDRDLGMWGRGAGDLRWGLACPHASFPASVAASAAFHKSSPVMLAAVKFFLGQDEREEADEDDDDMDDGPKASKPTAKDYYNATKKGTHNTKRKKEKRLKRVEAAVKKQEAKAARSPHEAFSALQLMHDPQTFAERLFSRLRSANERWETRVAMMQLTSRIIGVHKCLLLNFYPFLQKYISPSQRDETQILASLVQVTRAPPFPPLPILPPTRSSFVA